MKKNILLLLFITVNSLSILSQNDSKKAYKVIQFKSLDSITITADLYFNQLKDAPLLILFHQARFSRGEYRSIAPKLNNLGYNCLAIDQRSGKGIHNVINQTHKEAVSKGLPTNYLDALPDLEAAISYAEHILQSERIIIWGSSYSSALIFYLAQKYPTHIVGALSFSPGEYFSIKDKSIAYYAHRISCPVFITSAKDEHGNWRAIYDTIPSKKYFFLPKDKGKHGSKALWSDNDSNPEYWQAVIQFLNQLKK